MSAHVCNIDDFREKEEKICDAEYCNIYRETIADIVDRLLIMQLKERAFSIKKSG